MDNNQNNSSVTEKTWEFSDTSNSISPEYILKTKKNLDFAGITDLEEIKEKKETLSRSFCSDQIEQTVEVCGEIRTDKSIVLRFRKLLPRFFIIKSDLLTTHPL